MTILKPIIPLTERQFEVFQNLSSGFSIKETAVRMNIQTGTVKSFQKTVYAKIGANCRTDLRSFLAELKAFIAGIIVLFERKTTYTPMRGGILSKRQLEVFLLVSKGYTMIEIGKELSITMATARSHGKKIYKKLRIHSRAEARHMVRDLEALRKSMLVMFGLHANG